MLLSAGQSALSLVALGVTGYFGSKKYIDNCRVKVIVSSETKRFKRDENEAISLNELLSNECPSLTDPSIAYMVPTPYLCTGLLQTIYATLNVRRRDEGSNISYEREMLIMEDGGTISLDWYPEVNPKSRGDKDRPIALMLTGVGGSSYEYHVRTMAKALVDCPLGFRSVVVNHRGTARTPITSARPYDSGFTGDFRTAVKHIIDGNSTCKLVAVGFSMGANILTKYLGEEGESCQLACAVTICCPFDLKVSSTAINADNLLNNHVFQPCVMSTIMRDIKRAEHLPLDPSWNIDLERIRNAKKIWEIEDAVLVKINGFKDLNDYYAKSSSANHVDDIKVPLLAINSLNDRITPPHGIPVDKFKTNPNIALVLVPHGGHLAFLTGMKPKIWFTQPVIEFITSVLK